MTETTGNLKRRREDDSSPPKVLTMPGDICKRCNKKCTLKGKSSEAVQCDVFLCGCMPLVRVLLRPIQGIFRSF